MALEHVFEAFVDDAAQRLVQSVQHIDRRGVMVDARRALPVLDDHRQIQVPVGHFGGPRSEFGKGPLGKADRRQARRARQALLRAAVHDVRAPGIHRHGDPAQAGHGIDQVQRVASPHQPADFRHGIAHAGRRFGVDHGDQVVFPLRQPVAHGLGNHGRAPREFQRIDLGPQPSRHIGHPLSKHPVAQNQDAVAALEQIHKTGFHARRAGAADGQRQRIAGPHDLTQQRLDVFHDRQETRIQMADRRPRQRLVHLGRHARRAGPHQQHVRQFVKTIGRRCHRHHSLRQKSGKVAKSKVQEWKSPRILGARRLGSVVPPPRLPTFRLCDSSTFRLCFAVGYTDRRGGWLDGARRSGSRSQNGGRFRCILLDKA